MKDKDILEAKDVAKYLHLHLFTVHKMAREGKIPAFKVGTDWRFRKESFDQWIKEKEEFYRNKSQKAREARQIKKS